MISAGEESGKLGEVLDEVRVLLPRAQGVIKSVTAMIEPLMIVLMGGIVGFIAMSIILPIFKLSQLVKYSNQAERPVTYTNNHLITSWIGVDETGGRFQIDVTQEPKDKTNLIVSSTGRYKNSQRTISMKFHIDKKLKFAVAGKVPIQLGRNVVVEGPVSMTTSNRYPPMYSLSDFHGLTPALGSKIDAFNSWLKTNHAGYDNRVSDDNPKEWAAASKAGFKDTNGDGFIDEYDIFVATFDKNNDGAIDKSEFTNPSTGKLYDAELFGLIDGLGAPMAAGESARSGYQDGIIDNRDGYAKIRGAVDLMPSESGWKANSPTGQTIYDQLRGPIASSDGITAPVELSAPAQDVLMVDPANFDTSSFKARSGPSAGPSVKTPTLKVDCVLSVGDANGGNLVDKTPFGSTTTYATYQRPVFKNMTLRNVQIPKGLNALFDNCVFEGVTFVNLDTNITNSSGQTSTNPSDGAWFSQHMKTGSFSPTTTLTTANSYGFDKGNNLRFNNCTFNGPLASDVPTAYSHFGNSWEFTGATMFNNTFDTTATMVCPQTNIEMGSFTDPAKAPSTLSGVVVAGNLDIRGSSTIDGSIIVTGNGAANTTLGWFGASDASTDPTAPMPEGGWGKIDIRYNPNRPLPDGINLAIDLLPQKQTYVEGQIALSADLK
jgi:hypothetical protein